MKKHTNQHIDNLIEKAMSKSGLESPSSDFTASLMSQVENISFSKVTTYEPLISKNVWLISGVGVFIFYGYMALQATSTGWPDWINFSFLYQNRIFENLIAIEISKTTMYALMLTALMLLIQIPVLKYYFDKRLTLPNSFK